MPQGLASTLVRASERGLKLSKRYLSNEVIQGSGAWPMQLWWLGHGERTDHITDDSCSQPTPCLTYSFEVESKSFSMEFYQSVNAIDDGNSS